MEIIIVWAANLIVFALGSAIGSFLNVVIYRVPAGLSIIRPPSRCPQCLQRLGKKENIPIWGWLWLKGRCRYCKSPISIRYPLIETVTGIMFLLIFWKFDFSILTLGYWAFFSWLLALSLIDLDTMTLPNSLTQSGLIAGLLFHVCFGWHTEQLSGIVNHLWLAIVGGVLGIWLLDIIAFVGSIAFGQPAMGAGDAKLAAMMGVWLGWKSLLVAGFLACALGAFVGGGAIALGLLSRRQAMPFGPFLAMGAIMSAFWGEAMLSIYLHLFFPFNQ